MMPSMNWKSDWPTFVKSVCRDWDAGLTDRVIEERYSRQRVTWTGTVIDSRDYKGTKSIGVRTEDAGIARKCGTKCNADYLVLNVSPDHIAEWEDLEKGVRITFETEIAVWSPENPFSTSSIEWSDLGYGTGLIKVDTHNSRLIAILESDSA